MKNYSSSLTLLLLLFFSCSSEKLNQSNYMLEVSNRNSNCAEEFVHCNNPISSPTLHEENIEVYENCFVTVSWLQSECTWSGATWDDDEFHVIIEDFMISHINCPEVTEEWDILAAQGLTSELEDAILQFNSDVAFALEKFVVIEEFGNDEFFYCNKLESEFYSDFITARCQQIFLKQNYQAYVPNQSLQEANYLIVDCGLGCCLRTTKFCWSDDPEPQLVYNIEGYNNTGGCIEEEISTPQGYNTLGDCEISITCEEYNP